MTPEEFIREWENDSPVVEVTTSGSTGQPKRMMVEKVLMVNSARATLKHLGIKPGESALLCMSPDYIAGKMIIVRALVGGLKLIAVEPSTHPLADLGAEEIGLAAMVGLQVANTLKVPSERSKMDQIRHLIIGGGSIDRSLEDALQSLTTAVWCSYGMTETLSHIALRRVNGSERSEWYTPMPGVNVTLDETGRIVIDAPGVARTRLVTNDLGVMHSDGRRFRVVGRIDNVICSGGKKMQIEVIERLLADHIRERFVITGVPHAELGEQVVMLVEGGDAAEIGRICRAVLDRHSAPKQIINVPQIPLTPTGKPARKEAKDLAERMRH